MGKNHTQERKRKEAQNVKAGFGEVPPPLLLFYFQACKSTLVKMTYWNWPCWDLCGSVVLTAFWKSLGSPALTTDSVCLEGKPSSSLSFSFSNGTNTLSHICLKPHSQLVFFLTHLALLILPLKICLLLSQFYSVSYHPSLVPCHCTLTALSRDPPVPSLLSNQFIYSCWISVPCAYSITPHLCSSRRSSSPWPPAGHPARRAQVSSSQAVFFPGGENAAGGSAPPGGSWWSAPPPPSVSTMEMLQSRFASWKCWGAC